MARSATHLLTVLAFVATFATTMVAAAPLQTYETLHANQHQHAEYDAISPPGRAEPVANMPYIEVRCGGGQPNLLWTLYGVAIGVLATIAVTQELQRVRRRDRRDRADATACATAHESSPGSRVPAHVRSCACTAAAAVAGTEKA